MLFLNHNDLSEQVVEFEYPQNIYQFSVNVVDENNNNINLLGLDWTMVLELDLKHKEV